ncbi:unnamed protein product [Sphagnum jensenii]|uniref:Uncharacterized protein n=1 Tax=Sphagnum jensenii TaxID=128206 RepID=A0ABP0WSZ7_9BRYO
MAPASLAATNQKANSDLLEAAEAGDELKVVAALAQPGVDVNCCDERCYRRTPLLRACLGGDYKEVAVRRLLEDSRVNVNACDQRGQTALHLCYLQEELLEEILLFKRTDIDWNAADMIGQTPILWFARLDDEESVRRLIGVESVNLFATTIDLFTALHQVAESKTPLPNWAWPRDISNRPNLFLKRPEEQPSRDLTPLHFAAMDGRMEVVRLLLKWEGINIDAVDSAGLTPLKYSVQNGHTEVMKLLLKKGIESATLDYATLDYNRECRCSHAEP